MSEAYQHTEYELRNDIDNINCISYTFERYVEEVNHFIDRLLEDTKEINVLRSDIKEQDKEIERLNNIINELEKHLEEEQDRLARETSHIYEDSLGKTRLVNENIYEEVQKIKDKLQELKGSDKE